MIHFISKNIKDFALYFTFTSTMTTTTMRRPQYANPQQGKRDKAASTFKTELCNNLPHCRFGVSYYSIPHVFLETTSFEFLCLDQLRVRSWKGRAAHKRFSIARKRGKDSESGEIPPVSLP